VNNETNVNLGQRDAPDQTAVRLKTGRFRQLAWLPVPVLLATMVALRAADLRTSYESLNLLISLNFIFSTLVSLAVAFLMGRAFLLRSSPGVLLVGCGVLIWGVGSFVAPIVGRGNANVIVTIHNLCVWLAACSHLAGVSLSGRLRQVVAAPRLWVGAAYTIALGLVWQVTQAALTGWMPVFFVQGQGGTLVRQFVLSSAISMLVLTAALLWSGKGRSQSAFGYWYSLALLLLATGLFGVMIQSVHGSLLGWTGRAAQFLGGAYMIVAALASASKAVLPPLSLGIGQSEKRQRYLVAIVITVVAAAGRLAFLQVLGTSIAFVTFYPAVMISALYGGLGPGVLATVLSALLATYLWIEPAGHFFSVSRRDFIGLTIFFMNCMAISWITEVMRRAMARSHKAEMQARIADERERAAQVIQQSEAKYRSLFENMINGFAYHKMITDKNGRPVDYIFLEVNNAFEALTGLKRPDVVGKRVTEVLPGIENDLADWIGKYGNVALTGGELRFEQYAASMDKWYSILSYSPMKDYFVAIFEDITERKRAEEALRESEEKIRSAFANATIGFAMTTPDGQFVDANAAYCRLTGYGIGELRTMEFPRLIHPDDKAENMNLVDRMLAGQIADFTIENRYLRKGGQVVWVRKSVSLVRNAQGEPRWFLVLIEDITERKRAEDALQRSRAELEERVKERTRELADSQEQLRNLYSHLQSLREEERTNIAREIHDDLGQALTALKMDLSWIAGKLRGDNKGLKEKLHADVDQVDKTIQAVKRVCTELRPGILDHLGIVAAIEWQAEEFQKRTGIKCEVVFDPEDAEVDVDLRTPLFRIFQEALTNVLKHAKATRVKASFKRTRSSIILEITDNGVGIADDDLSKPNSFGLMGMRERVYPWGGKVTVSGVENEGTTVEVIIPVTTGEPS
jgi:PAS domain S-box-containing protein